MSTAQQTTRPASLQLVAYAAGQTRILARRFWTRGDEEARRTLDRFYATASDWGLDEAALRQIEQGVADGVAESDARARRAYFARSRNYRKEA